MVGGSMAIKKQSGIKFLTILVLIFVELIDFTACQFPTLTSCDDKSTFVEVDVPAGLVYGNKKMTFGLAPGRPGCGNDTFFYSIKTPTVSPELRVLDNGFHYFLTDGSVRIGNRYFRKNDYCVQKITKTKIVIQICKTNCKSKTVCIPKCCEVGSSFDAALNKCVDSGVLNWAPSFYNSTSLKREIRIPQHVFVEKLNCTKVNLLTSSDAAITGFKSVKFHVLTNGTTTYFDKVRHDWINLQQGSYCLDETISREGGVAGLASGSEMLALCSDLIEPEEDVLVAIIYGVVMTISCGLYVVTIVVLIILWDKQKFHMYIVISYIVSLLLLHIFMGTTNMVLLKSMDERLNGSLFCIITGTATHLFVLSTFCWLTMINMNLWSAFSTLNVPHNVGLSEGHGIARLIFFSLFSWGLPLAVVAFGLSQDILERNGQEILVLGPGYGENRCWISEESEGWYLFYPIGGLLLCNMFLFGLTVGRLCFYQRITRHVIGERSDKKWRTVNVYLRLLLIAAVLWVFELTSWILQKESYAWYWLTVDILNLFQSAAIFITFVCRKSICRQLQKKYPVVTKIFSCCSRLCCCEEGSL